MPHVENTFFLPILLRNYKNLTVLEKHKSNAKQCNKMFWTGSWKKRDRRNSEYDHQKSVSEGIVLQDSSNRINCCKRFAFIMTMYEWKWNLVFKARPDGWKGRRRPRLEWVICIERLGNKKARNRVLDVKRPVCVKTVSWYWLRDHDATSYIKRGWLSTRRKRWWRQKWQEEEEDYGGGEVEEEEEK